MKTYKKLIAAFAVLIVLGLIGTAVATYTAYTDITNVSITSPSNNTIVFAGRTYTDFFACTTSTDTDCHDQGGWHTESDPVTHTWSGAGTFSPTTGTTGIDWTAPSSTGNTVITVTANDSPLYNETAKTATVTVKVQNVIYVDKDATGANDGTTWANAFTDLQSALDVASYGNEIWVAEGTYYPDEGTGHTDNSRTETFQLVEDVNVYGGFAGTETTRNQRDWTTNVTILSGDIGTVGTDTDNSYHVVVGTAGATLDGFTIKKGYANYASTVQYKSGGGMYNSSCSPTVTNCIFNDNYALLYGGGMYNISSSPTVTDCSFTDNEVVNWGGGIYNQGTGSSPTISNCFFKNNAATHQYGIGGAISNYWEASPTITNCTFQNNTVGDIGGGIANVGERDTNLHGCHSVIKNCLFIGNSADDGGGIGNHYGSNTTIVNCTFRANTAAHGGAIYDDSANPTVTNCILWANTASVRGNQIDDYWDGTPTVTYSDVQGGWSGTGNINSDPHFVNTSDLDGADNKFMTDDDGLRLSSANGSPCIDHGNNNAISLSTDIAGNSRKVDDPNTTDGGSGTAPIVDMGAYEYHPD